MLQADETAAGVVTLPSGEDRVFSGPCGLEAFCWWDILPTNTGSREKEGFSLHLGLGDFALNFKGRIVLIKI